MNKKNAIILLAAALMAPATGWSAESVPYSSDLGYNYSLVDDWTQEWKSEKYWEYDRESNFSSAGTNGGMRHTYEPVGVTADAILLSPAISLTEGTTYTVGFWTRTGNNATGEVEAFKLLKGNARSLDALKAGESLIEVDDYFNNYDFELQTATFTASATEEAYFGIYCCSEPYQGTLCVTGFFINEGEGVEVPEKPEVIVELPYTADFSTIDGFHEWSSLAGPDAEVTETWSYNSWGKYPEFDRTNQKKEDNYFISPGLNITDPGLYAIEFEYTAQGTFDLMLGTDNSDPASFDRVLFTTENANIFNEPASVALNIDEPGKYYVALHLRAESGTYMGYRLHSFKIKHDLPVPALVTDLTATADGNDGLSVDLRWTNPAKTHAGDQLDLITKVEISRNGTLLTTLTENLIPGEVSTYTDYPSEAGSYNYTVTVYGTNGTFDGEPMTAIAGYVGRPVADFPFAVNINSATPEELSKYTSEDADNNGTRWEVITQYYNTSFTSTNGNDETDNSADNYLASPYIHLTPGYYMFTSSISSRCNNFEVGITTDRHNIADTFVKLGELNDQQEYGYNDFSLVVPIDEEGDYCLVWHHTGMSTNYAYKTVSLQSASLTSQALLPATATSFTAQAPAGVLDVALTWINPGIDNASRPLTAISKAEILRDGTLVATITDNLTPGEESTYTDTVEKSGEYTYSVIIYNENGCADAEAPTATVFAGTGREIPYTADFNEWTIVDKGSWSAWAVNTDGSAYFARGMFDDVEYNDGIYSPYLLLEEGKRYIVSFTTFGTNDLSDGCFTLQAGTSRYNATDIAGYTHAGKADKTHTLNLLPMSELPVAADDSDDKFVPAGNIVLGFHVFENAEVNVRSFEITADPNYNAITLPTSATVAIAYRNGIVDFADGVNNVTVADISGRVVYTADKAPASLDLRDIAAPGILLIKATAADGTPAAIKVRF